MDYSVSKDILDYLKKLEKNNDRDWFNENKKEFKVEDIQFPYGYNNAQPNLVSKDGNLTLSWISSVENQEAVLLYTQYKDNSWSEPVRITSGSDWFVNWADFPANAINGNLLLTSYLKYFHISVYCVRNPY